MREEWTPTQAQFDAFARVSGDTNPIHVDPDFCRDTPFALPVSHGMLIYARIWHMLARARPGARHRVQEMMFPNPAYAGEALVLEISDERGAISVRAARKADGAVCLQGRAVLE
ncbi:MaoC family dehydratase [Nioella sp.]|uniref:MaoC family dehydratase n=1 Tax=Nioella sp. TaxID=1912091 RepID=UPI00351933DE